MAEAAEKLTVAEQMAAATAIRAANVACKHRYVTCGGRVKMSFSCGTAEGQNMINALLYINKYIYI